MNSEFKKIGWGLSAALAVFLLMGVSSFARAADDDDEFFQMGTRAAAEKSRARAYPGSRDDQTLEMQTAVVQPSRSPDGTSASTHGDGDDAPATPPASD